MGINVNTGAGYVGEVELTYIVDGKRIRIKKYNKGWSRLFQFIARCLGDTMNANTIPAGRPQFLDIKCKHKEQGPTYWTSCLFSMIPVSPTVNYWVDDSMINYGGVNWFATFTTTISYNMINQAILGQYPNGDDDCALFLMAGSDTTYSSTSDDEYRMAQLLLDVESLRAVNPGTQVIVEWSLKFYNKEDV